MEGYDDQPAMGLQHLFGCDKGAHQFAPLVVDEHAQGLEGPSCWMRPLALPPAERPLDVISQIAGGGEGLRLAPVDNSAGKAPRRRFLAQNVEDVCEFGF